MCQVALGRGLTQVGGTAVVRLGPRVLGGTQAAMCMLALKRPFWVEGGVGNNAALSVGRPPLLLSSISLPSPSTLKKVSGSGVRVIFAHGHSLQLVFWVVFGIIDCIFSNNRVRDLLFLHVLMWLT